MEAESARNATLTVIHSRRSIAQSLSGTSLHTDPITLLAKRSAGVAATARTSIVHSPWRREQGHGTCGLELCATVRLPGYRRAMPVGRPKAFTAPRATLHSYENEEASSGGLGRTRSRAAQPPPAHATSSETAITPSIHVRFQAARAPRRSPGRAAGCLRAMPGDAACLRGEAAACAFDDAARAALLPLTVRT